MSGIGFSELLILFMIGLIVLGPERLPRVANQLGTWLGQARRMTRVMRRQLEEELDLGGNPLSIEPRASAPAPNDDDTYSPLHDPTKAAKTEDDTEPEVDAAPDPEPVDDEEKKNA
ncbi:MAG: Sec-independent protein translocase protein TatB [Gammaproteobacteria bacterium]|nr:Sec-independent protein translocase protein TatB [Gammaproteobacteria bacterium]MDH3415386.1 Sec-independent protein translocase protein TatB [Gammaproteobacteria bacterium]